MNQNKDSSLAATLFCPLPWVQLSVHSDATCRVCCNAGAGREVRDESGQLLSLTAVSRIEELYNTPFLKNLRVDFLNGRVPAFCRHCKDLEKESGTSFRTIYLEQYAHRLEEIHLRTSETGEVSGVPLLDSIDLSVGNHCNLACKMCNPEFSQTLQKRWRELGLVQATPSVSPERNTTWENVFKNEKLFQGILRQCRVLTIQGGEPFLDHKHEQLLRLAIDSGQSENIFLQYNTNLTHFPTSKVFLWQKFKGVGVHVSLEGHGLLNDYIRSPSRFSEIDDNLKTLLNLKAVLPLWVDIYTVVQTYNVLALSELVDYLFTFQGALPPVPVINILRDPEYLSIRHLPCELKQIAATRLLTLAALCEKEKRGIKYPEAVRRNLQTLKTAISYMMSNPPDPLKWQRFLDYVKKGGDSDVSKLIALIPEFEPYFQN